MADNKKTWPNAKLIGITLILVFFFSGGGCVVGQSMAVGLFELKAGDRVEGAESFCGITGALYGVGAAGILGCIYGAVTFPTEREARKTVACLIGVIGGSSIGAVIATAIWNSNNWGRFGVIPNQDRLMHVLIGAAIGFVIGAILGASLSPIVGKQNRSAQIEE
jgi:hypothetical protein